MSLQISSLAYSCSVGRRATAANGGKVISSDILLDLYNCPADPGRWRQVLDRMCHEFGVVSAVVQRFRSSGTMMEQIWKVRDTASMRDADLHDRLVNNDTNPRLDVRIVQPFQSYSVVRDRDIFRADCPHWAALRNRLRNAGLGESIGAGAQHENGESLALVLHRRHDDHRPFTEDNASALLQLLPHIENAVNLGRRLECQENRVRQIEEVADGLPIGILLFDDECIITWANDAAEEILRRSPHLRAPGGRLCAAIGNRRDKLGSITKAGAAVPSGSVSESMVLGADNEDELHIVIVPPTSDMDQSALLLSEPRRTQAAPMEEVARLLRVTPAEARVAAALCAGHTLKEYAESRGISEGCARNQLKQVLAKTGTRRQSELIRHLCSSVIFQTGSQRQHLVA